MIAILNSLIARYNIFWKKLIINKIDINFIYKFSKVFYNLK